MDELAIRTHKPTSGKYAINYTHKLTYGVGVTKIRTRPLQKEPSEGDAQ